MLKSTTKLEIAFRTQIRECIFSNKCVDLSFFPSPLISSGCIYLPLLESGRPPLLCLYSFLLTRSSALRGLSAVVSFSSSASPATLLEIMNTGEGINKSWNQIFVQPSICCMTSSEVISPLNSIDSSHLRTVCLSICLCLLQFLSQFSEYRSSTSLRRFILRYLIFLMRSFP